MSSKTVTTCDHCKKDKPDPKKHAKGYEETGDGWVAITYNGNARYESMNACSQACAQVVLAQLGAEPGALRAATLANAPDIAGEMLRLRSEKELLEKRLGESAKPITVQDVRTATAAVFSELRSLVEHLADQSRGQSGRTLGEKMLATLGQIFNR